MIVVSPRVPAINYLTNHSCYSHVRKLQNVLTMVLTGFIPAGKTGSLRVQQTIFAHIKKAAAFKNGDFPLSSIATGHRL